MTEVVTLFLALPILFGFFLLARAGFRWIRELFRVERVEPRPRPRRPGAGPDDLTDLDVAVFEEDGGPFADDDL